MGFRTTALFGVLQVVMPFTNGSRYPGAWNRKQKKCVEKKLFSLCGPRFVKKMAYIVRKYALKRIIFKIWTLRG